MPKRRAWVLLGLFFSVSCARTVQGDSFLKLPSGKQVKVLGSGPLINTSGKRLGIMFKYETELKVADKTALRKEADEVFAAVRPDAEKANETSVIVSAVEKPAGFIITKSQGYNLVFERSPSGAWRCLDDRK
jgi:hypothetical protein